MSKVSELELLSSLSRAVAEGRDFLDIEVLGGGLISLRTKGVREYSNEFLGSRTPWPAWGPGGLAGCPAIIDYQAVLQ